MYFTMSMCEREKELVCTCREPRLMCVCVLGTRICSYPSCFNLPVWNKPAQLISTEVTINVFTSFFFFFTEFNIGDKQWSVHKLPANNKTCSKRNTKPSSPASLPLTKDMFDVIQNNVYLPSVSTPALFLGYP